MPIGSILIGLALFLATIPFVIKPLLNEERIRRAAADPLQATPGDRHKETLLALRDLEFDHRTGKITDEDYAGLRASLLAQAAAAIEAQDKQSGELDALIEDAVRARRQHTSESLPKRFCSKCGHKTGPDDRFCAACGTSLTVG